MKSVAWWKGTEYARVVSWDIGDSMFLEEGKGIEVTFAMDAMVDCCGIGTESPSSTESGKTRVKRASCCEPWLYEHSLPANDGDKRLTDVAEGSTLSSPFCHLQPVSSPACSDLLPGKKVDTSILPVPGVALRAGGGSNREFSKRPM